MQAAALIYNVIYRVLFVTQHGSLPIAVIICFIRWFDEFGIFFGDVIANGLIQSALVGKDAAGFIRNCVRMQEI